jgi:hypothetical protein
VPSKNRAAQLDLFLRSYLENFNIGPVTVIYKATDKFYQDGYQLIRDRFEGENIFLIEELDTPIKKIIYAASNDRFTGYVNFCTDDTVFYRKSGLINKDIAEIITDDVCSFSPRLGLNTIIQDYKTGEFQSPLSNYEQNGEIIKWNWLSGPPLYNYYYPAHQDGCVMDKDFFVKISSFDWKYLRELEGNLALDRRHTMKERPLMAAPVQSICVNIPTNAVQGGLYCGDKYFQDVKDMNEKFLSGQELSLKNTDFSNIIGSHQEIDLKWD